MDSRAQRGCPYTGGHRGYIVIEVARVEGFSEDCLEGPLARETVRGKARDPSHFNPRIPIRDHGTDPT